MNKRRIALAAASLAVALLIYTVAGFLLVPVVVKRQLAAYVERTLQHRLTLGDVRFNPFALTAEIDDFDLRDASGGALIGFKRLFVNFEMRSVWDRAWSFAEVTLDAPALHGEIRRDGSLNFAALIAALSGPATEPDQPMPRLRIARLALTNGRLDFADLESGKAAKLRLSPISAELRDLSTLPSERSPYQLSARTIDGETVTWFGDATLNPMSATGRLALRGWKAATVARFLGRQLRIDAPAGQIDLLASYRLGYADGQVKGVVDEILLEVVDLAVVPPGSKTPLASIKSLIVDGAQVDLGERLVTVPRVELARAKIDLNHEGGRANWDALFPRPTDRPEPGRAERTVEPSKPAPPSPLAPPEAASAASLERPFAPPAPRVAPPPQLAPVATDDGASPWKIKLHRVTFADLGFRFSDRSGPKPVQVDVDRAGLGLSAGAEIGPASTDLTVAGVQLTLGGIALSQGEDDARLQKVAVTVATIEAAAEREPWEGPANGPPPGLRATVHEIGVEVSGIAAKAAESSVTLERAGAKAQVLSVSGLAPAGEDAPGRADGSLEGLELLFDGFGLRHGAKEIHLQRGTIATARVSVGAAAETKGAAGAGPQAKIGAALEDFRVETVGIGARLAGGDAAALEVDKAAVAAKALAVSLADGQPEMSVDAGSAALTGVAVREPRTGADLARLARAEASGATLRLGERRVSVGSLVLADGSVNVAMDAEGRLNWNALTDLLAPPPEVDRPAKPSSATPWHVAIDSVEATDLSATFTDRRRSPVLSVGLDVVRAGAKNVVTDGQTCAQIQLSARVKSGGDIEVSGRFNPVTLETDLKLKVAELSLTPGQPFLADLAHLDLASAFASTEGRLRYDPGKAGGAELVFEGSAEVEQVLIEETEPRQPLLVADSIAAPEIKLTLSPNALDITEVRVIGLASKLLIAEDRTVNFARVLKESETDETHAASEAAPSKPFPVSISRVRIKEGSLELSDLSLRPQFAVRLRELKGAITRVSTEPAVRTRLKLEGRVDEYGLARVQGIMNLLNPKAFADLVLRFRNIEMTALTPYSAKFAGYRIASGKLSMDLKYTLKDRRLVGQNQIVLDKLELGEKVDSPTALDLPIELAIALLKDDRGRIDIGLPVQGSLDNPQFSIGDLVGKAVRKLIGGIVTKPFRMLAKAFGRGSEKLDRVEFDPGSAQLLPPERQKLKIVAEGMAKRPLLKLTVKPIFSVAEDGAAIRRAAVRREIFSRMGVPLDPGDDPGPLDLASPRAQEAIEEAFAERFSSDALSERRARFAASAPPEPTAREKPAAQSAPMRSDPLHHDLFEELVQAASLADGALAELAGLRGEAVAAEMVEAGRIAPERVTVKEPAAAKGGANKVVRTMLELGVMR